MAPAGPQLLAPGIDSRRGAETLACRCREGGLARRLMQPRHDRV